MLVFSEREKPEDLEKRFSEQGREKTKLNRRDASSGNQTWATALRGERPHHYAIPAFTINRKKKTVQSNDSTLQNGKSLGIAINSFWILLMVKINNWRFCWVLLFLKHLRNKITYPKNKKQKETWKRKYTIPIQNHRFTSNQKHRTNKKANHSVGPERESYERGGLVLTILGWL